MLKQFKNLSFRKKIFVLCTLISLIPVIVLGTYCYQQIENLLITREKTAVHESLIQEGNALNTRLNTYIDTMNYMIWDNSLKLALSKTYGSTADMYITYRDIIDPMFTTLRALNSDINKITIYTENPMNPHGNVLRPLKDVENEGWYTRALDHTRPFFQASRDAHTLKLICRHAGGSYSSVIVMDIDYDNTLTSMDSLYEQSYGILLTDEENTPVYKYDTFDAGSSDLLTPKQLIDSGNEDLQKKYVIEISSDITGGWKLYLYRPIRAISTPAREITTIVLIIIFFCLISVIVLSSFLSGIIVRPLEQLTKNMSRVEQGDFAITVSYASTDEIGRVIQSFQHMVGQLRHLIDEVLKSKIKQQEYEMRALQAQINPHFLYNSLSLINGRALMAGQEDIGRMARLLSTFYRTTLNKGKNTIAVRDELENVRSYISIQFIMHSDNFDVTYDIDEEALPLTMINLLLQPLVENAIMHGIDHREAPGRGALTISCHCPGENIVFTVSDNGPGIPPQKLERILTSPTPPATVSKTFTTVFNYFTAPDMAFTMKAAPGRALSST